MIKIISFLLLIISIYGISAFIFPETVAGIENKVGIDGLGAKIANAGKNLNEKVTNTDLNQLANDAYNSAIDLKDKTIEKTQNAKETIDNLRKTGHEIEETATNVYNTASETLDQIQEIGEKANELKSSLESFKR